MTYSRGVFDKPFCPEDYFDHVRSGGEVMALPTTRRPEELTNELPYPNGVPGVEVVRVPGNFSDQRDLNAIEAARIAVRDSLIAAEIDR